MCRVPEVPDAELKTVAEQLRRKLAAAELRVQHLRAVLRELEPLLTDDEHGPPTRVRSTARPAEAARSPGTGAALLRVLEQSGPSRPWTAGELAAELAQQGVAPASADPANAVRTALGRLLQDNRIERVGQGQYAVRRAEPVSVLPPNQEASASDDADDAASPSDTGSAGASAGPQTPDQELSTP